jgi:hypothetical protein
VAIGNGPDAGAWITALIATLLTANLNIQRLLWSRQIEKSNDRVPSEAVGQSASGNDN